MSSDLPQSPLTNRTTLSLFSLPLPLPLTGRTTPCTLGTGPGGADRRAPSRTGGTRDSRPHTRTRGSGRSRHRTTCAGAEATRHGTVTLTLTATPTATLTLTPTATPTTILNTTPTATLTATPAPTLTCSPPPQTHARRPSAWGPADSWRGRRGSWQPRCTADHRQGRCCCGRGSSWPGHAAGATKSDGVLCDCVCGVRRWSGTAVRALAGDGTVGDHSQYALT